MTRIRWSRTLCSVTLGLGLAMGAQAQTATAALQVYLSDPADQASRVPSVTTENFEALPSGPLASSGTLALGSYAVVGGAPSINAAGVYGGAGGAGQYLFLPSGSELSVTLAQPESYVGFWWPAGDAGNLLDVYDSAGVLLATFTTADLTGFLGSPGPATALGGASYDKADYYGNPNGIAGNDGEPYAYVNLRLNDTGRRIGRLVFRGSNFEVDNLSVTAPAMTPDNSWVPLAPRPIASATDDRFATAPGTPLTANAAANDTGAPTGSAFSLVSGPLSGTLVFNADGSFSYTPAPGFTGSDSFVYQVCLPAPDTAQCARATVTLTVALPAAVPALSPAALALLGALLAMGAARRRRARR